MRFEIRATLLAMAFVRDKPRAFCEPTHRHDVTVESRLAERVKAIVRGFGWDSKAVEAWMARGPVAKARAQKRRAG